MPPTTEKTVHPALEAKAGLLHPLPEVSRRPPQAGSRLCALPSVSQLRSSQTSASPSPVAAATNGDLKTCVLKMSAEGSLTLSVPESRERNITGIHTYPSVPAGPRVQGESRRKSAATLTIPDPYRESHQ